MYTRAIIVLITGFDERTGYRKCLLWLMTRALAQRSRRKSFRKSWRLKAGVAARRVRVGKRVRTDVSSPSQIPSRLRYQKSRLRVRHGRFRAPSGWRVLTADGGAQVGSAATRASRWVPREESAPVLCLSPSPREQTVPKGFLRGNKLQRKQSSDTLKRRLDHLHHVGKSRHEQGKSGWVLSEL